MTADPKTLSPDLGDAPLPTTAQEMRALIDGLVMPHNDHLPTVARFWGDVPIRMVEGAAVVADVILPLGAGPFPVMVFLHGGAWVCGSTATHRKLAHRLAERGFLVVSVNFRLAPEHPYPASLDDCVEAVMWVRDHAGEYGGDPSRFVIVGDSSGANLAAAAAGVLGARPGAPAPAALGLIYGYYDYEALYNAGQGQTEARGTRLSGIINSSYFGTLTPSPEVLRDPGISPIHAAGRLPPVVMICGVEDIFLAQHDALAAALKMHGVPHVHTAIEGLPHGFLHYEEKYPEAIGIMDRFCDLLLRRCAGEPLPS